MLLFTFFFFFFTHTYTQIYINIIVCVLFIYFTCVYDISFSCFLQFGEKMPVERLQLYTNECRQRQKKNNKKINFENIALSQ